MCGIFGLVTDGGHPPVKVDDALSAIAHRGPDGSGRFVERKDDVEVVLMHARLAVVDTTEAASQPMTSPDGRYVMVFNGEVYNFAKLRSELEARGESFSSSGDSEVVLRALCVWGRDAIRRFRGMFAIALYDRRERSLLLVRDRLGIKPLYFARIRGGVCFGSEVRALLATGLVERRFSREGLESYLAFGSVYEPFTLIEGVRALPPGTYALLEGGRFSTATYWEPPLVEGTVRNRPEVVEELRAELMRAMQLHVISDVPLGVFLSGGVDSSAMVALASRALDRPITAITVAFEERSHDESRFADLVARRFGCDHRVLRLAPDDAASELPLALSAQDQPSADGVNTYLVAKAARRQAGLKVVLSGLGGDELFAGYPNFRRFPGLVGMANALRRLPPTALRQVGALVPRGAPTRLQKIAALVSQGATPVGTYGVMREMFGARTRQHLGSGGVEARRFLSLPDGLEDLAFQGHAGAVNAFSVLELRNYMLNTLLRDSDVMSMAHGLELRVPLLDHVVVEKVLALHGTSKLQGPSNKQLLIDAVGELPSAAVDRTKRGFDLPFDAWFRGPLREFVRRQVCEVGPAHVPGMDRREAERAWSAFERRSPAMSQTRIWCLAALASWAERNKVDSPGWHA